jgi:large conductance mechanosensitive channel
MKDFKAFLLQGNLVDLAVAVVIGVAFGAVVTAFVSDLITPLIAAVAGKHDFSSLSFTINGSRFASATSSMRSSRSSSSPRSSSSSS